MTSHHPPAASTRWMPSLRSAAALGAGAALLMCAPSPAGALATLRGAEPSGGAVAADLSAPLVAVVALVAWLLTAWLLLALVLTLASRLPGLAGRATALVTRCVVPLAVRRALELALGLTVVTGAAWASPAAAADGGTAAGPPHRPAGVSQAAVPSLDWPVGAEPTAPAPAGPAAPVTPAAPALPAAPGGTDQVVVAPGDTLWSLAERSLGGQASDAQVAATWPSWWEANREAIGDDPDLLHPGQALSAPPSTPGR